MLIFTISHATFLLAYCSAYVPISRQKTVITHRFFYHLDLDKNGMRECSEAGAPTTKSHWGQIH